MIPIRKLPARFAAFRHRRRRHRRVDGHHRRRHRRGVHRPAATEASTATATAAAKTAVGLGTGFVDIQCTAVQRVAIESGNGLVRLDSFSISTNAKPRERPVSRSVMIRALFTGHIFRKASDSLFGRIEIEVAYEYIFHSSPPDNLKAGLSGRNTSGTRLTVANTQPDSRKLSNATRI